MTDVLPLAELRAFQPPDVATGFPQVWLDDDGRRLVLADVWVRWLFVTVVDLEASTVTARVSLRTPRALGRLRQNVCVDGEVLRVIGESGHYLELSLESWEVLRWGSLGELLPPEVRFEDLLIVPRSPHLWVVFRSSVESDDWAARVVDVPTWRVCRNLPGDFVQLVPGPSETAVLATPFEAGARLYSPRGTAGPELRLPPESRVINACVIPGQPEGLWLVTERQEGDEGGEDDDRVELLAVEPTPRGPLSVRSRQTLAGAFEDADHPLAAAFDADAAFVLLGDREGRRELLAFARPSQAEAEGAPKLLWRRPVPHDTVLAQDRHSRYAVALRLNDRSLAVARLTAEPIDGEALGDPCRAEDYDAVPRLELEEGARALAAGDLEAARAALDRPATWRAREIQSAARLADVHLRLAEPERDGPPTGARRFDTRLALAYFSAVCRQGDRHRRSLEALDLAWDETRLRRLTLHVRAWFESDLGGGQLAVGRTLQRPRSRRA